MGRPALTAKTKEAIREAAVTLVRQRKRITPLSVAVALNWKFGGGGAGNGRSCGVRVTPGLLSSILRGEKRIGRDERGGYFYVWVGP